MRKILLITLLIISSCFTKTSKTVNNDKINSHEKDVFFNSDSLKINNSSFFSLEKPELIKKFHLVEDENDKGFKYFFGERSYLLYDDKIGVIFFSIRDNKYRLKNPNIHIGMSVDDILKMFPNAYESRVKNKNRPSQEVLEIHHFANDGETLRLYLKDDKVYEIAYLYPENEFYD